VLEFFIARKSSVHDKKQEAIFRKQTLKQYKFSFMFFLVKKAVGTTIKRTENKYLNHINFPF